MCKKCSIAYNGVLRDNDARLTQPLRRSGPKGSGRFEPVSWGEALGEIAARLDAIVAGPGPATILNTHYTGTCALLGTAFPMRFFNRLGATEVDPDTICNKAGYEALSYLYGASGEGFDPETAVEANCVLVWGANPSASAPHQQEHWLAEAPGTVVVVDPIRTPTAAAADLHLQPFPGSDAALAFAFAHILQRDGLVDRGFVEAAHDRLRRARAAARAVHAAVGGGDDGRACPVDRAGGARRTVRGRRSCGSARASSVNRGVATRSVRLRCFPR